jgi:hypothetical protein
MLGVIEAVGAVTKRLRVALPGLPELEPLSGGHAAETVLADLVGAGRCVESHARSLTVRDT